MSTDIRPSSTFAHPAGTGAAVTVVGLHFNDTNGRLALDSGGTVSLADDGTARLALDVTSTGVVPVIAAPARIHLRG